MSNFSNKTITSKGLELLSATLSGGTLEFTRIVMGSGVYSGDIGLIESLVNQKQSLDIKSITRKGSQVVLSTTLLQNAITEDFYWKEVGVYAKGSDGLEILYMYGSASEASYISKDMLNEKMINIGVLVSNATNITATINNSLVYLSREDLQGHNDDENSHQPLRVWITNLLANLTLPWSKITAKPDTYPPTAHEHNVVTTSANGFMSTTDKVKLNGIDKNANNYTHPGSGTNPHGTTKSDVGLGSVQNYGVATTEQAQNGTADNAYMTPLKTMQEIEAWYTANKSKFGGDIVGKKMQYEGVVVSGVENVMTLLKFFSYAKGGMVRIIANREGDYPKYFTIKVDGSFICQDVFLTRLFGFEYGTSGGTTHFLDIPFDSEVEIYGRNDTATGTSSSSRSYVVNFIYYLNK